MQAHWPTVIEVLVLNLHSELALDIKNYSLLKLEENNDRSSKIKWSCIQNTLRSIKTYNSAIKSYTFLLFLQNQSFYSQNYNNSKNMKGFSETFTVKVQIKILLKNLPLVFIQRSLKIRSNNNTEIWNWLCKANRL